MRPQRLCIVGVGLIGGSLGLAVRGGPSRVQVVGYTPDAGERDRAADREVADEVTIHLSTAVDGADWVVLATPVGVLPEMLRRIGPHLAAGAVVTDVGSTKGSVVAAAVGLAAGAQFVGSHPMVGSEKRGVEHARADLFQGGLCLLTPSGATDPAALGQVDEFWRELGMRTAHLPPADHDRLVAQISHAPHAVAAAVVHAASAEALPLAGRGFIDATRIAAGDPGLWRDILLDNAPAVLASVAGVKASLEQLEHSLAARDGDAVLRWLSAAAAKRRAAGE